MRRTIIAALALSLAAGLLGGCGGQDYVPPKGFQTAICNVQIEIHPEGSPETQSAESTATGGKATAGEVKIELKNKTAGEEGAQYDVLVNGKKYGKVAEGQDIVVDETGGVWVYSQKRDVLP